LEAVVEEPFSKWGSTSARQKKYGKVFSLAIYLTMDLIVIVLLKHFKENSKCTSGRATPSQKKSGGLGPCSPPGFAIPGWKQRRINTKTLEKT